MERKCYLCNTEIIECRGYALARDVLKLLENPASKVEVRELCGIDIERLEFTKSMDQFLRDPEKYKRIYGNLEKRRG